MPAADKFNGSRKRFGLPVRWIPGEESPVRSSLILCDMILQATLLRVAFVFKYSFFHVKIYGIYEYSIVAKYCIYLIKREKQTELVQNDERTEKTNGIFMQFCPLQT